jgi:hypothetical protein
MAPFLIIALITLPAVMIIFLVIASAEENNNMSHKTNAKYAFYYLLSLVALVFTALSTGMIIFSIIDKSVTDAITQYGGMYDGPLKFAISALLIAAPIFYILSRLIIKGLRDGELDKESAIRRWLTYFIILVSSLIILGVFIGVMNNFLSGELTLRFILKALTVLVISGGVCSYYFYDLKRDAAANNDPIIRIFLFASLAVVIAAFIAAWFFVESPQTARERRLDQVVVSNIYSLESAVNQYYERNQRLPESLDELREGGVYLNEQALIDPESKEKIEYRKLSEESYEFCATFRLASDSGIDRPYPIYSGDNKYHEAGYQCVPGTLYNAPFKGIR